MASRKKPGKGLIEAARIAKALIGEFGGVEAERVAKRLVGRPRTVGASTQLQVRLSAADKAWLAEYARTRGGVSEVVRGWIEAARLRAGSGGA